MKTHPPPVLFLVRRRERERENMREWKRRDKNSLTQEPQAASKLQMEWGTPFRQRFAHDTLNPHLCPLSPEYRTHVSFRVSMKCCLLFLLHRKPELISLKIAFVSRLNECLIHWEPVHFQAREALRESLQKDPVCVCVRVAVSSTSPRTSCLEM